MEIFKKILVIYSGFPLSCLQHIPGFPGPSKRFSRTPS